MRKKIIILACLLSAQTAFSISASAQVKDLTIIRETNKVALVIGNSDYQNGFSKLNSPRNDAAAMAEALKRLGFRLIGGKAHLDAGFSEMEKLLDQLTDELKNGGVGFFYFSGHGSQDGSRDNFLIPVDTSIRYKSDLKHKALKVEFVTSRMEETGNRLNILVLDACRNNPLPSGFKSGDKGLNTGKEVPSGVYIAFAARDGQVAADGDYDGYSLYTRELLKNIEISNVRLEDIFIETRIAVKKETGNKQSPFDYGSIDGIFYFKFEGRSSSLNGESTSVYSELVAPLQISPVNKSNFNHYPRKIVLRWNPVVGAKSYKIQTDVYFRFGTNAWACDIGNKYCITKNIAVTELILNFYGATLGRWRVWVVYENGKEGPSSPWWEFEHKI